MATAFNTRKRIRRFFGHIESVAPMPNLIEVQKSSYEGFLQRVTPAAKRTQSGLQEVFRSVFPIKDFAERASLEFVAYEIELGAIGKIADRKDRPEHFLEARDYAGFGTGLHLQKFLIGAALNLDEVRHLDHFRNPSEGLADTLTASERARDRFCHNDPQSECRPTRASIKRATGHPGRTFRRSRIRSQTVCSTNGNTMPPGETLRFAPAGHR